MTKKTLYVIIVLPMVFILAACASLQIPGVSAKAQPSQSARQGGFNTDPTKMPVEQKLGIGILKLEGTPQAITKQQAQQMLPLWQALKTLNTSNNTSQAEITALYKQIQDVLTPAQVQAIQNLTWTQSDLRAMMQQYGIQTTGFGNGATLDPSARATRVAQFQSQGGGGGGGGGFGGGGGGNFGGGGGGNFGGGGGQGGANVQRTPVPGQSRRGFGGMNIIFVDPVIKLLQQKTGA
jgi:hypothetical protein